MAAADGGRGRSWACGAVVRIGGGGCGADEDSGRQRDGSAEEGSVTRSRGSELHARRLRASWEWVGSCPRGDGVRLGRCRWPLGSHGGLFRSDGCNTLHGRATAVSGSGSHQSFFSQSFFLVVEIEKR